MKVLLTVALLAVPIVGDLRPWRYSVEEHLRLCHSDGSPTLTSGSTSYIMSNGNAAVLTGTTGTGYPVFPSRKSEQLQRQADAAKACEKTEQDLRELLTK